jgi:uncharacterized protein
MADTALVLFAKEPRPGAVKTRLTPPLTPNQASELSQCFLADTVDYLRPLQNIDRIIAYDPPEAASYFTTLAGDDFSLLVQPAGDLGARLTMVFSTMHARGYTHSLAIGSDAPTLPVEHIVQAVDLLHNEQQEVVIGPSTDGGYYLIGMRGLYPAVFQNIDWSTERVCGDTLRQAERSKLSVGMLPPWYDVDTIESLEQLREDLEASAVGMTVPRHTRRFLQQF